MDKRELHSAAQYALDNPVTINFATFMNESKNDDSLSTEQGLNKASGGKNPGSSMTFYFDAEYVQAHKEELAKLTDIMMGSALGMQSYYRNKLGASQKNEGIRLYNAVQAMRVLRGIYGEEHKDDLDQFWNLKMSAKAEGTKIRTRLKFGSQGDHISMRNRKGERVNKITLNQPGTGLVLISEKDTHDYISKVENLQQVFEDAIGVWSESDYSNENMHKVLESIVLELQSKTPEGNYKYWPIVMKKDNPLDVEMVKKFIIEACKYMEVDSVAVLQAIKF